MTVKTGVKSIAEITFQGGVIRINEKSSVVMKELAKNIRDNKEMTELFVESGQSLFKVTKKLTDGEKFNVTTATAVAAVRGTEFTVAADEKKTLIACKEGRIAVKESSADDSAFVVIGPGEEALVEEGKPVLISLTDKKVKGEIKQNDALSGTNPSAGEMKGSAKIRAEEVKGEIENK
jgi:hypothetical protein